MYGKFQCNCLTSLVAFMTLECILEMGQCSSNLAYRKPSSQMNGIPKSVLSAFDGDADSNPDGHSCTHIYAKSGDAWFWLFVYLGSEETIQSIRLSVNEDIEKFSVEVSKIKPYDLPNFPGKTPSPKCLTDMNHEASTLPVVYTCDQPVTGRYVRIFQPREGRHNLSICEFEVYSHQEPNITTHTRSLDSISYRKPTEASFVVGGSDSSARAVDGHLGGTCKNNSCTMASGWWIVDLQHIYTIDSVRIMNCVDCCQNTLQMFIIEVSIGNPHKMHGFPERTLADVCLIRQDPVHYGAPQEYKCKSPVTGRYVRLLKDVLNEPNFVLCEFEVFGDLQISSTSYPNTTVPESNMIDINDKDQVNQMRFTFVTSTGGLEDRRWARETRRHLLDCASKRVTMGKDMNIWPYFHMNVDTGECTYLQNASEIEMKRNEPLRWIVFKLKV